MKLSRIGIILAFTFRESIRAKWLLMFSAVFFLLALNVPMLVLLVVRYIPPNYLELYLDYLVTLSFPFLPLLSLPMASGSIVEERESGALQYLLSNPISKMEYLVGRTLGLLAATTTVVILGYGLAALVAFNVNYLRYAIVAEIALIGVALNAIMIGLALMISILSKRKASALGIAIFAWFLFTVLSDLGFLSVVVNLSVGPNAALPMILTNPVEISRILAVLTLGGSSEQLGSTGLIVTYLLGSASALYIILVLSAWLSILFGICFLVFRRQDVT